MGGGFRVRFVPGMCVSICFSWKFAWVVFVCANFVRMQFPVKIPARFVILSDRGAEILFSGPPFCVSCSLITLSGPPSFIPCVL